MHAYECFAKPDGSSDVAFAVALVTVAGVVSSILAT